MIRIAPASLAMLLTATCTTCASSAVVIPASLAPAASEKPIRIRVPSPVGRFILTERRGYDERAGGVMLRYAGPHETRADVFLYPGPDLASACDTMCAAEVLKDEVANFRDAFPELIGRGYYQSMYVVADTALRAPAAGPWRLGHHLVANVTRDGKPARSDFYLFYLPHYRVKVRATYEATPDRLWATQVFVAAVVPALVAGTNH